jgi:GR25 family glycosyltransferase involved in LPS biosynthesis
VSAAAIEQALAAEGPVQHPCPPRDDCPYCQGTVAADQALDWSFLDAVYCISLKTRNDRAERVAEQFHKVGLCRKVVFYRPVKHPVKGTIGSWESHRAVAGLAAEQGARTSLVFEDDVLFVDGLTPRRVRAIGDAIRRLPPDWFIFYLGHWPLWCYFVRPNVLRTSSACAHAYVSSPRLLEWLQAHPHASRDGLDMFTLVGHQLDAAFARLPGTYALFPMIATQSVSVSDNFATTTRPKKKLKHWVSRSRNREWLLSNLMRPAEALAVAVSPVSWLVQRVKRAWR